MRSTDKSVRWRLTPGVGRLSVADYRRGAQRKLPSMVWDYLDGAAEDHVSLEANRSSFGAWSFMPNVLTGNAGSQLGVEVAGIQLSMPLLFAPTGLTGLAHWSGEIGAAQAAERAGVRAVVSTAASYTPEEVAQATREQHFFQLYPWINPQTGRELIGSFIERAEQAGYAGLFVTVDAPARGNREGEVRRGMGVPPTLTPRRIGNAARKPRWSYNFLRHGRVGSRLLVEARGLKAGVEAVRVQIQQMRPDLKWEDIEWIRKQWAGPMFVKGILNPADASRAIDAGADGIVVSNHGGRQLDGVISALDALPAVVNVVANRVPVLMDGGIRRGSDIAKAICLGARAVMVGRPFLYGLAVEGVDGAHRVVEILREELTRTLTFLGVDRVEDLKRSHLVKSESYVNEALWREDFREREIHA